MKCLTLDNYNDFECIGSQCPSTCCAGWGVLVDLDSANLYESISGEFGDKLRKNLIHKDNICYFKMQDNRCPFLNEENLCDIFLNLGKDKMCSTCKYYPRFQSFFGDIMFRGLNISCPEVARILFQRTDFLKFDFAEISDEFNLQKNTSETEDWPFFNVCIRTLTTSITLLQERTLSLHSRLQLFLLFASQLQSAINKGEDTFHIFDLFSNTARLKRFSEEFGKPSTHNVSTIIALLMHWYKNLPSLKNYERLVPYFSSFTMYVNERNGSLDVDDLNTLFGVQDSEECQIQHEQYCCYLLFRHFMKCYKEHNIYKYAVLIIYLYCLQISLEVFLADSRHSALSTEEQVSVAVAIAKSFEHATVNNLDVLYQVFCDSNMTNIEFLMTLFH